MKHLIATVTIFLFCAGVILAQTIPIKPIPSFNVPMKNKAAFTELKFHPNTKEKRDMDVIVTSRSSKGSGIYARVWAIKGEGEEVLGPYIAWEDQLLKIPISGGKWSALVDCMWDIEISIWIDGEQQTFNAAGDNCDSPVILMQTDCIEAISVQESA